MGTVGITRFFLLIAIILRSALTSDPDYVLEEKFECRYTNGTERIRLLVRLFYNKEEYAYFDSDIGKFITKTELGSIDVEYWNKNTDLINYYKGAVQAYCVHNYNLFRSVTADRRVDPSVKISVIASEEASFKHTHTMICKVYGYYPSGIEVKLFRNEQEQTVGIGYSGPHSDGDWIFQFWVSMETDIERGDTFTCEVHHVSLKDPLRVHWKPNIPDSAKSKMVTGIVGFVLGAIFILVGLVLYLRSRKALASVRGHTTEYTPPVKTRYPKWTGHPLFDYKQPHQSQDEEL